MHTHTILMSKRRKNEGGSGESTIIAAADFEASKKLYPILYVDKDAFILVLCTLHSCVVSILFLVSHTALHFHFSYSSRSFSSFQRELKI